MNNSIYKIHHNIKKGINDASALLVLLIAVLLFFKEIFCENGLVFNSELFEISYPCYKFILNSLKSGVFPLWLPNIFCGTPLAAHVELSLFSPLHVPLFLSVGVPVAFNVIVPLYFFLAGAFMYLYGRVLKLSRSSACIAAMVFMCNGYILDRHSALHSLSTIVWLPLILFFMEKGFQKKSFFYIILAGVVFGIQLLGGQFQEGYYAALLIFGYTIYKGIELFKRENMPRAQIAMVCAALLTIFTLGIGMSAIQIVPTYELAKHSARVELPFDRAVMEESSDCRNNVSLTEFIFPNIFGGIYSHPFIPTHPGIVAFLLAITAILCVRNRLGNFYLVAGILSLLLSLGRMTPFFWLFYHLKLPGFSMFKSPDRIVYIFIFSLAILSGMGMDVLIKRQISRTRLNIIATITLCFILAITGAVFWIKYVRLPLQGFFLPLRAYPEDRVGNLLWLIGKDLFIFSLLCFFFILALRLYLADKIRLRIFQGAAIMLVFLNMFWFGRSLILIIEGEDFKRIADVPDSVRFIKNDTSFYRVFTFDAYGEGFPELPRLQSVTRKGAPVQEAPVNIYSSDILIQNMAVPFGTSSVSGDMTLLSRRFLEFTKGNFKVDVFRRCAYADFLAFSALIGLFNCKYVITKLDSDRFSYDEAFKEVYRDDICKIYLYKDYLPRVFFAQKALVIRNEETMLNILKNASFNPRETVLLEEEPEVQFQGGDRYAKIQTQIISYEPNEVTVYNESGKDGFLVLLDSYYPGWKAYVNGRLAKIYRADYLFRAVYLQIGRGAG